MPAKLSTYGVGDGGDKLPTQTKVSTQLSGKLLRTIERVGEVPLKLVIEGNVANMDV